MNACYVFLAAMQHHPVAQQWQPLSNVHFGMGAVCSRNATVIMGVVLRATGWYATRAAILVTYLLSMVFLASTNKTLPNRGIYKRSPCVSPARQSLLLRTLASARTSVVTSNSSWKATSTSLWRNARSAAMYNSQARRSTTSSSTSGNWSRLATFALLFALRGTFEIRSLKASWTPTATPLSTSFRRPRWTRPSAHVVPRKLQRSNKQR